MTEKYESVLYALDSQNRQYNRRVLASDDIQLQDGRQYQQNDPLSNRHDQCLIVDDVKSEDSPVSDAGAQDQMKGTASSNMGQSRGLNTSQRSLLTEMLKQSQILVESQPILMGANRNYQNYQKTRILSVSQLNLKALPLKQIDFSGYRLSNKNLKKQKRLKNNENCGQCSQCSIF